MSAHANILLIDSDAAAGRELSSLLLDRPGPPHIFISLGVMPARHLLASETIDWLFIRISEWDNYQLVAASMKFPAPRVIFLSGRSEKCTDHLGFILDAHLQAPYRPSHLIKCWNKLSALDFTPRPLDFFFLKTKARYIPIRYRDLKQVRRVYHELHIQTRQAEYRIAAGLAAFQARLPIPLVRVRRGLLVNEAYEGHDGAQTY